MKVNLFQSAEYKSLMESQIEGLLSLLFKYDQEFAVACELKYVTFDPPLPSYITEGFGQTVLFVITNYTFETAYAQDGLFGFEAGFGEENFGSVVTMPYLAIKQIFVGETPLLLNHASPAETKKKTPQNSMEVLLSNPENQKLLKKKQR
jgi:hypothetical protein